MRQLWVQLPRGQGDQALAIVQRYQAANVTCLDGQSPDGPVDLLLVHLANADVGPAVDQLQSIDAARVTLIPQGVLPLRPPMEKVADQVSDVTARSPLEVFLGGIQSVGSWRGFLAYAVAAGGIVWTGLFTDTIYLLIAAMLIAPFAGPAMNASLATARGDPQLLLRSLARYVAALCVSVAVAALLSLVMQQQVATTQMVQNSHISSTAVLLPLIAGAAGALTLVQSERSSLVSGAATGMLVAASLAPPAGLIGMASVLGEWTMVYRGLFLLALQIAGINFAGALVFRASGVRTAGSPYQRGHKGVFPVGLVVSVALLALLLAVQFWDTPYLQRSTRQQRAAAIVQQVFQQHRAADLIEADVRFTRPDRRGQNALLTVVYAQARQPLDEQESRQLRQQLAEQIDTRLQQQGFNVTPLVDVTLFDPR